MIYRRILKRLDSVYKYLKMCDADTNSTNHQSIKRDHSISSSDDESQSCKNALAEDCKQIEPDIKSSKASYKKQKLLTNFAITKPKNDSNSAKKNTIEIPKDFQIPLEDTEKTNKDGKPWNFKICSWNIAGIRAWVKKNGLEYIKKENPDIITLQEVKCRENQLPIQANLPGYYTYWIDSQKGGYAGVALYSKIKPVSVKKGLGIQEHDSEGRVITAEYDHFYVIGVYVPNAGSQLKTLPKRLKWDKDFLEFIITLNNKKPVVLCGDLNVAHERIDLARPDTNTKTAGFTVEERTGMTELLGKGFVDSFRYLYPEITGAYTFWAYFNNARARNTGWYDY